jgi:hypothetical protein
MLGTRARCFWPVTLVGVVLGCCFAATSEEETRVSGFPQLERDLGVARQGRILFSHQSVGGNILAGIKQLDGEYPGTTQLHVASLDQARRSGGPALIDVWGGRNGEPKTKIDFFNAMIRSDPGLMPNLALMKLCFVDFNPRTDVDELFGYYRDTLEALERDYPKIRFAHVTVPLVERPDNLKWTLFRLIGKEVWEDSANVKRTEFNLRLREHFRSDPVFDLARIEATSPDGQLTTFRQDAKTYPSLYPGYSEDGAHLNRTGQRVAGAAAIHFFAEGLRSSKRVH